MFDDQTLGPEILSNPASIQALVLTEFQNRLGGTYSVADPNNTFNIMLEATSSMNAQTVRYMESQFAAQYAVRALTSADLYNSMSDFDYLNMVANPSSTTVNLTFDLNYLINNALSYDSTYKRIVIPAVTQFYIGPLTFGIYYPINININKITNNVSVLWDTTTNNPLQTLTTNMIPFSQYTYGGLSLITLQIPVSQFIMNTTTYSVVAQQGFIQTISYADQFYAVRVFTNLPTGSWTELAYTLSETVYDPTTPTAKITIQNDTNNIVVSIPQIYFTNSQIGNQVQVVILSTKGEITLDLTSVELSNCNASFGIGTPGVTAYSSILSNLATIALAPAETVITGGSSALSFTQLRNLIVNGGLYTIAPVTPAQLDAYAQKNGFSLTKYIDNVTDRIYYASNTIAGGQNGYIGVTTGNINVTHTASEGTSTIISFPSENAITILPTTIYTYDPTSNVCTPLTDSQSASLTALTGQAFVNTLNGSIYTKCPFHLVTYTSSQYPVTKSFNLMNPTAGNITYVTDNTTLTPQMSATTAVVVHNNNGTGGYTIRLGVVKNPAMQAIAESNITVCLVTTDVDGNLVYGTATRRHPSSSTSSLYIYEMQVPTSYYISETDTIETTLSTTSSSSALVEISLVSKFNIYFLLNPSLYPTIGQNADVVSGLPSAYSTLLGVSRQTMVITFGTDLSNEIYNVTNATWTSTQYATYPETVYQTYASDIYETTSTGALAYIISGSELLLNKLHSAGDLILPVVTQIAQDPTIAWSLSDWAFVNNTLSITNTTGTLPSGNVISLGLGIANITITNSGGGYTTGTGYALTAVGPGEGFVGTIDVNSSGQLTNPQVTTPGFNYTSETTFTINSAAGTPTTPGVLTPVLQTNKFTAPGNYTLTLVVSEVSGELTVSMTETVGGSFTTTHLGTITTPGTYTYPFTLTTITDANVLMVASGVAEGQSIVVTKANLFSATPLVQYQAGSIKLDATGNPLTIVTGRSLQYFTSSIMFDLRLFYSQYQADITFVSGLTATLSGYFNTLAQIQSSLLEQTQLYYLPNRTLGNATFSSGNNTPITLNLGFSFSITLYVAQSTLNNQTLQTSITNDVISIIQNEMSNSIISMTNIATSITSQLSDVVSSVDVNGIDGTQTLQTIIVPSGTTTPIVALKLVLDTTNNNITLQPDIAVKYVLAS